MKFECGDLERALAVPDLMPEAREHLKTCAACRREYRLWTDISTTARELHEEWDTPSLWLNVRTAIEAEQKAQRKRERFNLSVIFRDFGPRNPRMWAVASVVAAAVIGAVLLMKPMFYPTGSAARQGTGLASGAGAPLAKLAGDATFLTENALAEVEKNEAAYRNSIDRLAAIAQPEIAKAADEMSVNYRERLLLLDSAIAETRANLEHNRYSVQLQKQLADLYHKKQKALEELLARDQKN
jgi:hypothetical protein